MTLKIFDMIKFIKTTHTQKSSFNEKITIKVIGLISHLRLFFILIQLEFVHLM